MSIPIPPETPDPNIDHPTLPPILPPAEPQPVPEEEPPETTPPPKEDPPIDPAPVSVSGHSITPKS
ncbi:MULTISPECIES: hypothetical protein [Pseudomonas]|uniref:Uncharacterized protein n=1 Tax=Pseudomonas chlororaphis TaxID=587753 RepID=A0AAX3FN55_9PSED|nr:MULTISPECIES: hypothetical protein [Pseudomonas]AVO58985.1 hypothetical protein C6Q18_13795 [Pseudomonas chlororaphis subsp. piscium]AZC37345.1 hypothetical protein C4K37_2958 [Pseudomonas chlororaphis subsp. piscium]AZC43893.1 hypothetical protein C4K36_2968 [Pseudomonas chlororaphis subsp. piscium]AZC63343.1 hypothetical protein C4K33_2851 [Pseudomonas chlororaphis subsp. piscium]AZC82038.1 hypothetical protein C4K30_2924 [Pseudomonas chlororaphis subsp. piscium]